MSKYGWYNFYQSAANGDITIVNKVGKMKWREVFNHLMYQKDLNDR